MKCINCDGTLEWKTTPYHIDRNGYHLSFDQIPAWICPKCGETYFEKREVEAIEELLQSFEMKAQELKLTA